MRSVKLSTVLMVLGLSLGVAFFSGCDSAQLKDLRTRNQTQQARIQELESQLQAAQLKLAELTRQLDAANASGGVEVEALRQKIAALEEDIAKKEELIKSMQANLMGVSPLPVELNTALEDFAKGSDMIEYDASRGLVKFKSDLLFEKGSDDVTASASDAVKTLCGILNTDTAKQFHIVVAGHTDDMPIRQPQTRAEHPTNWHLSVHRAIAVEQVMEQNGIATTRLSVRGFGEYRPLEPNLAGKKGNPKNRRVEIYIVPAGA